MNNMTDETFQAYTGVEKRFSVDGKTLVVPARLDTFITYRTNFRKLAKSCSDNALQEYKTSVNDLDTFMEHLPQIYQKHLDIIAGKAIDILIAEGVYDYSVETFTERHMASFCNTLNDYQTMQQNIEETQEENYGVKSGIAKGLGSFLTRNSSNFVKSFVDGATDSFADGSEKLTNDQKAELYQHIILRELFNDIFSDYWNTVITMVEILRENLHDIWLFDSGEVNDIGIIIQNIKNPNFPQDKIVDILFDYILKKPNEERVYKILEDRYGTTEEIAALLDYFIYPDFANTVYTKNDFPEQEAEDSDESSETEQNSSQQETFGNSQNDNDAQSVGKSEGGILKRGLKIGAGILAAGMAMSAFGRSNQSSGSSARRNNSGRKSLWGTAMCPYGKKGQDGWTIHCNMGCPLWTECGGK